MRDSGEVCRGSQLRSQISTKKNHQNCTCRSTQQKSRSERKRTEWDERSGDWINNSPGRSQIMMSRMVDGKKANSETTFWCIPFRRRKFDRCTMRALMRIIECSGKSTWLSDLEWNLVFIRSLWTFELIFFENFWGVRGGGLKYYKWRY